MFQFVSRASKCLGFSSSINPLGYCRVPYKRRQQIVDSPAPTVRWDDLPQDILALIFQRLDVVSRIRFSLVSKWWRSAITQPHHRIMWMLLPREPASEFLTFFDLNDGIIVKVKLPQPVRGFWCDCLGSSRGWLILIKKRFFGHHVEIFLFNPFSRQLVALPPVKTIFSTFKNRFRDDCSVMNVQMSSSDASQCVVAVNFGNRILGLWRPTAETWSTFDGIGQDEEFRSLLFSEDGTLYSLFGSDEGYSMHNNQVTVFQTHSVGLAGGDVILNLIPDVLLEELGFDVHPLNVDESLWVGKSYMIDSILVESNGEVLIVQEKADAFVRKHNYYQGNSSDSYEVSGVNRNNDIEFGGGYEDQNYEVENEEGNDEDGGEVVNDMDRFFELIYEYSEEVECIMYNRPRILQVFKVQLMTDSNIVTTSRLNSLGDRALLIGPNGSSSVSTENFSRLEKNCVYFTQTFDALNPIMVDSVESGVFHLSDGRIQRIFPETFNNTPRHCLMSWYSADIKIIGDL